LFVSPEINDVPGCDSLSDEWLSVGSSAPPGKLPQVTNDGPVSVDYEIMFGQKPAKQDSLFSADREVIKNIITRSLHALSLTAPGRAAPHGKQKNADSQHSRARCSPQPVQCSGRNNSMVVGTRDTPLSYKNIS
jgi:hypothetical protein